MVRNTKIVLKFLFVTALVLSAGALSPAWAERVSDIANTKHNFSSGGGQSVRATSENELCVFCHTPHGASQSVDGPLWNREASSATYTPYSSSSMDVIGLGQPGGSSKLCLSCHDGTIAIGNVNVLNGALTDGNVATEDITMMGTNAGKMPTGSGADTGFTRLIGTDLTNDHPISFTFDSVLSSADGELRDPSLTTDIGNRTPGYVPKVPLENGQVQCTSCHDPHIRDTVIGNIKFLRLNRFQKASPTDGAFDEVNDIICLSCHDKSGWANSAHANPSVANETYTVGGASLREFDTNVAVWKVSCLNCHDTHTVKGARRLLREGTDSTLTPKSGGNSAIEETCYQCHSADGGVLNSQGVTGFEVPNVKTDFNRTYAMPIDNTTEVHDIGTGADAESGADFTESQAKLGSTSHSNRHAECTDCHNPHRVIKNHQFNDSAPQTPDTSGTHNHAAGHTNLASGVLKGMWGVEPNYGSAAFGSKPSSYTVKKGDPAPGASTLVTSSWVTREYQICLKCHSDYGFGTLNANAQGVIEGPSLGCCTPSGTNGLTRYTNQAMEFQSPDSDKGDTSLGNVNHRSWHPVMEPTGRTYAQRGNMNSTAMWLTPWRNDVGTQTMYCSDCHGNATANGTAVPNNNSGTENGDAWGPHGSTKPFILKGDWTSSTGSGQADDLCFKCHSYSNYATRNSTRSGFCCDKDTNLHGYHADKIGYMKCTWCHVAIPHGWKNKAFLVNLNDVGPEVGLPAGTHVRNDTTAGYTKAPYYLNAILKVRNWRQSGSWLAGSCGSTGSPGNGESGREWMRDGSENCADPP